MEKTAIDAAIKHHSAVLSEEAETVGRNASRKMAWCALAAPLILLVYPMSRWAAVPLLLGMYFFGQAMLARALINRLRGGNPA